MDRTQIGTVRLDGETPQLSGTLAGSVERTAVGQTADGRAFSKFHIDGTIAHAARSIDVEFRPVNFRGLLDTSLGVDNIDLSLTAPPAQP